MEAGGQAYHLITNTIAKEGDLSTRVWALPLACAKLALQKKDTSMTLWAERIFSIMLMTLL